MWYRSCNCLRMLMGRKDSSGPPVSRKSRLQWSRTQSASLEGGERMLVLSRKLGEKIYINDNICITVVDIDRGKIRLGIEAPGEGPIFRQELRPGHDQAAPPAATVTAK